jgi:hypothetical protein
MTHHPYFSLSPAPEMDHDDDEDLGSYDNDNHCPTTATARTIVPVALLQQQIIQE